MRKRPNQEEKEKLFIEQAVADKSETETVKEDLHKYVKYARWPLFKEKISPSLVNSSNLLKPMTLPMKEFEWDSIERHVKALGVKKTEWIRHAIYKLMEEEQVYFLKTKDKE